jgi:hypothetical protein
VSHQLHERVEGSYFDLWPAYGFSQGKFRGIASVAIKIRLYIAITALPFGLRTSARKGDFNVCLELFAKMPIARPRERNDQGQGSGHCWSLSIPYLRR